MFCLFMAFHLFNTSADMPDAAPDSQPEDLTINDMESVLEIVLEKGLNIENAIAEHDEADDTNTQNFEICKDIKFQPYKIALLNFNRPFKYIFLDTPYKIDYSYLYYKEINPPPPQA